MYKQPKHHSKLVKTLTCKSNTLNQFHNPEDRLKVIDVMFIELIEKLATFGPILKVIHGEYLWQLRTAKKNVFVQETLKLKRVSPILKG